MRSSHHPGRRAHTLGAGLSLALFAAALAAQEEEPRRTPPGFELSEPQAVDDGVPAALEGWEDTSCAECHTEIAREWAGSRHGLAWVDPHYTKALKKMRRPESCHGCHAPEPLHVPAVADDAELPQKPAPRERRREHGIDCRACHEGPDGVMLGPRGVDTLAHETAASPSFTRAGRDRLCIACHATHIGPVVGLARDYEEQPEALREHGCVGCHMAPVERSHAHDPDEPSPAPVRAGRSHSLQTPRDPAFLRQAFALSAIQRGDVTVVRVENSCGHRVPGLDGRELELVVQGFDAARGKRLETRFTLTKDAYLPAGEPLEIPLEQRVDSVRVTGTHSAPGFAEPVEFLALELVPGG